MTTLTAEHQLLIRATTADGARAIDAWREWHSRTNVDALDADSQWLLPLLFHNLHAQGVALNLLGRYRNVYRHNWYKNHLALQRARTAIDALEEGTGPVIVLGAAAMALRLGVAAGARPFESVDALLSRQGAAQHTPASSALVMHRSRFGSPTDAIVVARATPVQWRHRQWFVLDPADQLVDICVRPHDWDRLSKLFWMTDAAFLLRRCPAFNWPRVARLAIDMGQQEQVALALHAVAEQGTPGIPTTVLRTLESSASSAAS